MAPVLRDAINGWGPAFEARIVNGSQPGDASFMLLPAPGVGAAWPAGTMERLVGELVPWVLGGGSLVVMYDNTSGEYGRTGRQSRAGLTATSMRRSPGQGRHGRVGVALHDASGLYNRFVRPDKLPLGMTSSLDCAAAALNGSNPAINATIGPFVLYPGPSAVSTQLVAWKLGKGNLFYLGHQFAWDSASGATTGSTWMDALYASVQWASWGGKYVNRQSNRTLLVTLPGRGQPAYADIATSANGCALPLAFGDCADRCRATPGCNAFVALQRSAFCGGPACYLKSGLFPAASLPCSTCTLGYFVDGSSPTFGFSPEALPSGASVYVQMYVNRSVPYDQPCKPVWVGKTCRQGSESSTATVWDDASSAFAFLFTSCVKGCQALDGRRIASGADEVRTWYYSNVSSSATTLACDAVGVLTRTCTDGAFASWRFASGQTVDPTASGYYPACGITCTDAENPGLGNNRTVYLQGSVQQNATCQAVVLNQTRTCDAVRGKWTDWEPAVPAGTKLYTSCYVQCAAGCSEEALGQAAQSLAPPPAACMTPACCCANGLTWRWAMQQATAANLQALANNTQAAAARLRAVCDFLKSLPNNTCTTGSEYYAPLLTRACTGADALAAGLPLSGSLALAAQPLAFASFGTELDMRIQAIRDLDAEIANTQYFELGLRNLLANSATQKEVQAAASNLLTAMRDGQRSTMQMLDAVAQSVQDTKTKLDDQAGSLQQLLGAVLDLRSRSVYLEGLTLDGTTLVLQQGKKLMDSLESTAVDLRQEIRNGTLRVLERVDAINASLSLQMSQGFRDISGSITDLQSVVVNGNQLILRVVQAEGEATRAVARLESGATQMQIAASQNTILAGASSQSLLARQQAGLYLEKAQALQLGRATSPIADKVFDTVSSLKGDSGKLPHPADVGGLLSHIRLYTHLSASGTLQKLQSAATRFAATNGNTSPSGGGTSANGLLQKVAEIAGWDADGDGVLSVLDVNTTLATLGGLVRDGSSFLKASTASALRSSLEDLKNTMLSALGELSAQQSKVASGSSGGAPGDGGSAAAALKTTTSRVAARDVLQRPTTTSSIQRIRNLVNGSTVLDTLTQTLLDPGTWSEDGLGTITAERIGSVVERMMGDAEPVAENTTKEETSMASQLMQHVAEVALKQVISSPSPNDRLLPVLGGSFKTALSKPGGLLPTLGKAINAMSGTAGPGLFSNADLNLLGSGDGWDAAGNKDGLVTLADVGIILNRVQGLITNPTAQNALSSVIQAVTSATKLTLPGMAGLISAASGTDGFGSFLMDQLGPYVQQVTSGTVGGVLSDAVSSWTSTCAGGGGAASCLRSASKLASPTVGRTATTVARSVGSSVLAQTAKKTVGKTVGGVAGGVVGAVFGPVGSVVGRFLGRAIGGLFGHHHRHHLLERDSSGGSGGGGMPMLDCASRSQDGAQLLSGGRGYGSLVGGGVGDEPSFWEMLSRMDHHPDVQAPHVAAYMRRRSLSQAATGPPPPDPAAGGSGMSSDRAAQWEAACVAMKKDLDAALALLRDVSAFTTHAVLANASDLARPDIILPVPDITTTFNSDNGTASSNATSAGGEEDLTAYLGPADMSAAAVASRIASAPDLASYLDSPDEQLSGSVGAASKEDIIMNVGLTRRALKAVQAAAVAAMAAQAQSIASPAITANGTNGPVLQLTDPSGSTAAVGGGGRCVSVNLGSLNTAGGDPAQLLSYLTNIVRPQRDVERAAHVQAFLQTLQVFAVQYRFTTLQPVSYSPLLSGQRAASGSQPSVSDLSSLRAEWQSSYNRYLSGMGPATRLSVALEFPRSDFPRLFSDLLTANGTVLTVEPPSSTIYYNTRVRAVRAYVFPAAASGDSGDDVMQFSISRDSVSSFFATPRDALSGTVTELSHSRPQPLLFAYSRSNCQPLSTTAGADALDSTFVRYSPYGSWGLRLQGQPGSVLSGATVIRLEFDVDTYTANDNSGDRPWPLFAGQSRINILAPGRYGGACMLAAQAVASSSRDAIGQASEPQLAALVAVFNFTGAAPQEGTPAYAALATWVRSYLSGPLASLGVVARDWADPRVITLGAHGGPCINPLT
ncbi:hypothetical protein GPECTOR_12g564 [Gonium pectorale]|uniref:EF-hand domain-containing protein n=1 Tax=Gonium pectorale TaxID=33097 RepID=A0A150GQH4_GONPE|nr:hypothetical protein GPECTOR_12g564 [Gonium pectorale]|eukprot:KXZ51600.1 hypothetical protein GPECTOR_12g564 [Gonium pectorale]